MGPTDRYVAYAAAFEEAYASDNWAQLEPFFTEDAVDVIGNKVLGLSSQVTLAMVDTQIV